jgi:hypothetical protein
MPSPFTPAHATPHCFHIPTPLTSAGRAGSRAPSLLPFATFRALEGLPPLSRLCGFDSAQAGLAEPRARAVRAIHMRAAAPRRAQPPALLAWTRRPPIARRAAGTAAAGVRGAAEARHPPAVSAQRTTPPFAPAQRAMRRLLLRRPGPEAHRARRAGPGRLCLHASPGKARADIIECQGIRVSDTAGTPSPPGLGSQGVTWR